MKNSRPVNPRKDNAARANYQKLKLLKLMELLQNETDEDHPLTTRQICRYLGENNISCDRRTLGKDIAYLNDQGYEVMSKNVGHEKGYYIADRTFSIPELKILIDAVQASCFITQKKTAELIEKIAHLNGIHCARYLKENMVFFNRRKHSNESVYYSIAFIEEALRRRKKVSFYYFDLDENGERVYRRDKERYVQEPMALVFHEDRYYLICYCPDVDDNIRKYRIDRMDSVEVSEESISDEALTYDAHTTLPEYTQKVFKMYGGPEEEVTLRFHKTLLGVVYDKFGEHTPVDPDGEDVYTTTIKVQISPTFWGWIFQFGGQMKITSPGHLIEEFRQRVEDMLAEWSSPPAENEKTLYYSDCVGEVKYST